MTCSTVLPLPFALIVIALSGPTVAAPPARALLDEVDAFRELAGGGGEATWSVDGEVVGEALDDLFGTRLRPDEVEAAAATLRCVMSCGDAFSDRLIEASGAQLDGELVSMTFDDAGTILTTVGQARGPGQLAVTFERDTYRPRAIELVTTGGHRIDIALLDYARDGWTPQRVTLRIDGGPSTELVRQP